ncbi:MAG: hypothetical protein OZ924_10535 [Burkholderiaceae bacterium]|nr:hypothetical protein [Burkholderiaceae bacterium]
MYQFDRQLSIGEEGEAFLDGFFAAWFHIRRATPVEQRQGIDRWFVDARGRRQSVEYKADSTAARTGNAFVETISVDITGKPGWAYSSQARTLAYYITGKPGWAYSSQARTLAYYIPPDGLIYIIRLRHLRVVLPRWERDYPTRAVSNAGYHTHGLLVPLHELERLAVTVFTI